MTDVRDPALSSASELMRTLGVMVDGPARWGNPVTSRGPGVFVVELPGGSPAAPIDIVAVRRWVERVPGMLADGEPAIAATVARRLESFWLPGEPVLYVGRSARAISARVAAMYATQLGDARPYSGGHWLKTLSALTSMRVWWAETDAHEEYEDALIGEIAARAGGELPFANLVATDGTPKPHGLTRSLRSEPDAPAPTSSRPSRASARRSGIAARPRRTAVRAADGRPAPEPTYVSRDGLARLSAELEDLRSNARPQVIARVKAARELGDLKENGDYEYARKEQSFVEGRIQTLETMIKHSSVIDDSAAGGGAARLGSTVIVESDGERQTYVLVGSAEADPSAGRISNVSPVGRALIGAGVGDEVTVQLPAGSIGYRVIDVR